MKVRHLLLSPADEGGAGGGGAGESGQAGGEQDKGEVLPNPEEIKALKEENARLKAHQEKVLSEKKESDAKARQAQEEKDKADRKRAEDEGNKDKVLEYLRADVDRLTKTVAEKDELISERERKDKEAEEERSKAELKLEMVNDFKKHLGVELVDESLLKLVPWNEYAWETGKDGKRKLIGGEKIAAEYRKSRPYALKLEDSRSSSDAPQGKGSGENDGSKNKLDYLPEGSILGNFLKNNK